MSFSEQVIVVHHLMSVCKFLIFSTFLQNYWMNFKLGTKQSKKKAFQFFSIQGQRPTFSLRGYQKLLKVLFHLQKRSVNCKNCCLGERCGPCPSCNVHLYWFQL